MSNIPPPTSPTITVTLGQLRDVGVDNIRFETPEDQQVFLDAINKAYAAGGGNEIQLEIPRPQNAGDLGLLASNIDEYESILGSAYDVLLVLRKLGQDMEKSSREAKHAAREGEYQLMLKSADKIREAAIVEMVAGIVAGALQIAGGALAARGSIKAMKVGLEPYQAGAGNASTKGTPLDPSQQTGRSRSNAISGDQHRPQTFEQKVKVAEINANAIQGKWNAILQVFMGSSGMANSIIGVGAKELEAQKAEIDAEVKKAGYKVDDAKESQDTFKQLKDEMQRMFSEFSQSEYQMNKTIWS